jgi:GT2 family glycosyltransferase
LTAPHDHPPGVDVVVPCYNGARYLAQTLETALAQTYRPLRILVVDDGSTDATRRVVESYRGRVDYVFKPNGGQASARNLGLARTRGEYVCLLDADDLLAPEMVARLVERLERQPEADLAHSPPLALFGNDRAHPEAEHWRPAAAWGSYLEPLSILCAIHGSATVFRRRAFERFGTFPETRALQGCEDWHFWLQAVAQGAVVAWVPEVLCLYRKHLGSSSASRVGIARRESELMRAAVGLFDRRRLDEDRHRAILSVGVASVAGRWLALGDAPRFREILELARGVASPPWRALHLDPLRAWDRPEQAPVLQARLADALLDLDLATLASVLFLRSRAYRSLNEQAARHGAREAVGRVVEAAGGIVAAELQSTGTSGPPSYATHLALALAIVERSEGRHALARERLEQALRLDPNNARATLEAAWQDSRAGRLGATLGHARQLAARRRALVPAEIGRWVVSRLLRPAISPGGRPSSPPRPGDRPA